MQDHHYKDLLEQLYNKTAREKLYQISPLASMRSSFKSVARLYMEENVAYQEAKASMPV